MIIRETKIGESLSIGFLFNEAFLMSRLETVKVFIGSKIYAHTIIDHMVRCELKSDDTNKLNGTMKLTLDIDDSILGVKKILCGDLKFNVTNAQNSNESVNTGYDIVIPITINEQAITVDDILYDYVKGANGVVTADSIDEAITDGYTTQETISDTDLIISQGKKKFSLLTIWNYIKAKIGIVDGGSTDLFLTKAGTFAEIVQSGGATGAPVYMSNVDSDIVGYKKLSTTIDAAETLKTIVANNNTVTGEAYLFDLPIGVSVIPAGNWDLGYWRSVSNTSGTSTKLIELFVRNPDGTEQSLVTFESTNISDTVLTERQISRPNNSSYTVNPLGRFGVRSKFKTTRTVNTTLTYVVGDGRGWWMRTPIALRHSSLRDINGDLTKQHFDSTSEKITPIASDSLGLWDSVTSTFKKLSLTNLLVFLQGFFIGKQVISYAIDSALEDAVAGVKIIDNPPYNFNLIDIFLTVAGQAPTGGKFYVNVYKNGVSIFSTILTVDDGEVSSRTASVPYVFASTPTNFITTDLISIEIVQAGSTTPGKNPIINFIVKQN